MATQQGQGSGQRSSGAGKQSGRGQGVNGTPGTQSRVDESQGAVRQKGAPSAQEHAKQPAAYRCLVPSLRPPCCAATGAWPKPWMGGVSVNIWRLSGNSSSSGTCAAAARCGGSAAIAAIFSFSLVLRSACTGNTECICSSSQPKCGAQGGRAASRAVCRKLRPRQGVCCTSLEPFLSASFSTPLLCQKQALTCHSRCSFIFSRLYSLALHTPGNRST